MRTRNRLSKFLLRRGVVYYGGKTWTATHEQWLRRQRFTDAGRQLVFDEAFDAMLATRDRRDRFDAAITQMAATSEFAPVVTRLGCLRGVSVLTGFAPAVEIGDWQRFTGNTIGAYLGLVPTRVLLGGHTGARRVDQNRQQSQSPPAGGSGLAAPQALPARGGLAAALGRRQPGSPRPRTGRQPAAALTLAAIRRP
jgi:hypothetical protein